MSDLVVVINNWRKARASGGSSGNCVEVGWNGIIAVRDSKDRNGGTLAFEPDSWSSFTDAASRGFFKA